MWPESITDADRVALKSSLKSFKRSLSWTVNQVIMNTVMNTNRGEHVVLDINDDMQMTKLKFKCTLTKQRTQSY